MEPLASRLCEHGERRCKTFDDVEPLASRLREHGERRCKRFDGVKPLAAPLSEHLGTLEEDRERLSSREAPRDGQEDDLAPVGDALLHHGAMPAEVGGPSYESVECPIGLDGARSEEPRVLALRVLPVVRRSALRRPRDGDLLGFKTSAGSARRCSSRPSRRAR